MQYSKEEVMQYVQEDDVKFIRLAFCDVFGKQKNISIMPDELPRAFTHGIAFDASSIRGFGDEAHSDLFLRPESATLSVLPWRPEHGKVVRMYSRITDLHGVPYECDTRTLLQQAVVAAEQAGISFHFGAEQEFYLFTLDEAGKSTLTPYDEAGYMDIAPEDKGENVRREICLTLEQMGIRPESSHHEAGPGQNEIDFRYSDPLTAADNVMTFQTVVRTIAHRNGLYADFSPKPLPDQPGNGFHINISAATADGTDCLAAVMAGILDRAADMTLFLNPVADSYLRFGHDKAPRYISWSSENRSQLIRIPAATGEYKRAELRSPDPMANPYLAFALLIYAGLDGIESGLSLPPAADFNLFHADQLRLRAYAQLPQTRQEARRCANGSAFINKHLPWTIVDAYCNCSE